MKTNPKVKIYAIGWRGIVAGGDPTPFLAESDAIQRAKTFVRIERDGAGFDHGDAFNFLRIIPADNVDTSAAAACERERNKLSIEIKDTEVKLRRLRERLGRLEALEGMQSAEDGAKS